MSADLLLTVDELRAALRLAGAPVPDGLSADDPVDAAVDLAALRGLAVRGLLADLDLGAPVATGALAELVGALDEPSVVVEVDREGEDLWVRTAGVSVTVDGIGLLRAQLDAGSMGDDEVRRRCGPDEAGIAPDVLPGDIDVVVADDALVEADRFALRGEHERAAARLCGAGLPSAVAERWVGAVAGRRDAVAVRCTHHDGGGGIVQRELRWLIAGDGTTWMVQPASADPDASHLTTVAADELSALIDASVAAVGVERPVAVA